MRYVIVSLAFLVLTGCNIQKLAANQTVGVLAIGAQSFFTESDYHIAGDAMPANLKTMEALGVLANENVQLMEILSQSYCSYALGWLEPNLIRDTRGPFNEEKVAATERVKNIFQRGKNYAFKGLDLRYEGFSKASTTMSSLEEYLQEMDEDDVPLLAWGSFCWGSALKYKMSDDMIGAVVDVSFLRAIIERAIELDPEFYHGVGYVILGSLEATTPKEFGGDAERATELFNKAIELTDRKFLLNQATYAEYFGQHQADEEVFTTMLQEVMDAPEDLMPEEALANTIAKERAKALLSIQKELF